MRVAYVCADRGVPIGGTKGCSVHVRAIVRALVDLGLDVTVFAARVGDRAQEALGAATLRALVVDGKDVDARNRGIVAELRRAGPFDLIIERFALRSFGGLAYARGVGAHGILEVNAPLVEEEARYRELRDRDEAERAARNAFALASRIVAVSEEVAAHVRSTTEDRAVVDVIPNGVDLVAFRSIALPEPTARGPLSVGFVGGLRPWHGVDRLVDAIALLDDTRTRLWVVGDGPERAALEALAAQRRIAAQVEFVGSVAPDEVPAWLSRVDVAVAPYPKLDDFYYSPLKLFEYLAAGRAVVASEIGQIRSFVRPYRNGLLVPPGNTAALAKRLAELRDDRALLARLARAARDSIDDSHGWDRVARRIVELAERAA